MAMYVASADEAIKILGGTSAVAKLYDEDVRVVMNWARRGLPAKLHWSLGGLLTARDCLFDPTQLFDQRPLGPRRKRKR